MSIKYGWGGIEPPTRGFFSPTKMQCLTNRLTGNSRKVRGSAISKPGSSIVVLELFASAAAIQPSAVLEAGLMEQEQHPRSAVLP